MTDYINGAATTFAHNLFFEKFDSEKMKSSSCGPWKNDKDSERKFDLHRGLLSFKYISDNSEKSESALKSGLSRFK